MTKIDLRNNIADKTKQNLIDAERYIEKAKHEGSPNLKKYEKLYALIDTLQKEYNQKPYLIMEYGMKFPKNFTGDKIQEYKKEYEIGVTAEEIKLLSSYALV